MFFQKIAIVVLGILTVFPCKGGLVLRAGLKVAMAALAEIFIVTYIRGYRINPENRFVLWVVAYPLVFASVGAVELFTGKPFVELADRWNGFTPIRREQIGFLAIALTLGLFAIACALYARISITSWCRS